MQTPANLPKLANDCALTPTDRMRFQRDGHLLLRGVASPEEVAAYRTVILAARDGHGAKAPPGAAGHLRQSPYEGFECLVAGCRDAALGVRPALCASCRRPAGRGRVRVCHDQAVLKEAGGGMTPWHQGQHYWPLATDHTRTMWKPLVAATPVMGTKHLASGSHRGGDLGDLPLSDEGDATFHYGWTLHGAPGNSSDRTREVMTLIWYPDGTRVGPLDNANRRRDRDRWLPGLQPGDLAATELNPLVFWRKPRQAAPP